MISHPGPGSYIKPLMSLESPTPFNGAYAEYQPGIPNSRYHIGVVAGTAPDHTSCNVYVLGGQNETDTPGDIWALSHQGTHLSS